MVPDEGEQPVIGDVEGGELGRFPFLFLAVLGGAFDPCSGFLSVRAGSLWQLCCSGQLSSLFVRRPGYYPPEFQYLSACRYSSSMVAGGSRERD